MNPVSVTTHPRKPKSDDLLLLWIPLYAQDILPCEDMKWKQASGNDTKWSSCS